jgi:hypothetical protein
LARMQAGPAFTTFLSEGTLFTSDRPWGNESRYARVFHGRLYNFTHFFLNFKRMRPHQVRALPTADPVNSKIFDGVGHVEA